MLKRCNKLIDTLPIETVLILGVICGIASVLSGIFVAQSEPTTMFGLACFSYCSYRLSKFYINRNK